MKRPRLLCILNLLCAVLALGVASITYTWDKKPNICRHLRR